MIGWRLSVSILRGSVCLLDASLKINSLLNRRKRFKALTVCVLEGCGVMRL